MTTQEMETRSGRLTTTMVLFAILLLLAALAVWWIRPVSVTDPEDMRLRRAEQACLSSTESERGGNATTRAGLERDAVSASAGVSSRDVQKRGPGERVATADLLKESDAIRACIERRLAADGKKG